MRWKSIWTELTFKSQTTPIYVQCHLQLYLETLSFYRSPPSRIYNFGLGGSGGLGGKGGLGGSGGLLGWRRWWRGRGGKGGCSLICFRCFRCLCFFFWYRPVSLSFEAGKAAKTGLNPKSRRHSSNFFMSWFFMSLKFESGQFHLRLQSKHPAIFHENQWI